MLGVLKHTKEFWNTTLLENPLLLEEVTVIFYIKSFSLFFCQSIVSDTFRYYAFFFNTRKSASSGIR